MAGLGGLLSIAIGVVGIATGGLGLLAGGLLIAGGLAASGLIGGSVGKFMQSGWGQGLMAAASLGSAGIAMYGESALTAGTTADASLDATVSQTAAQNSAAIGASTNADLAASNAIQGSVADNAAITTSSDFSGAAGTGSSAASIAQANPALSEAISGTDGQTLVTANANTPLAQNAGASQASAAQTQATQAAAQGNPTPTGAGPATGKPAPFDSANAPTGAAAPAAGGNAAPMAEGANGLPGTGGANPDLSGSGMPDAQVNAPDNSGGGYLKTALQDPKVQAAAVQGGLGLIGGLGSGMMQQSAMQKQIAAQQWGNAQWQQPNQVAGFEAAAAQPITVPSGYLQRAQQIRGMMAGGVPTPSTDPVPVSSAMAPPGVGGPVPMSAMGAPGGAMAAPTPQNPRGGVI